MSKKESGFLIRSVKREREYITISFNGSDAEVRVYFNGLDAYNGNGIIAIKTLGELGEVNVHHFTTKELKELSYTASNASNN